MKLLHKIERGRQFVKNNEERHHFSKALYLLFIHSFKTNFMQTKSILIFTAILLQFQVAQAQWTVSGNNTNYALSGRVGIGTTLSDGKLDVRTATGRGIYTESFGQSPSDAAIYARGKTKSVAVYGEGNLSYGIYGFSHYSNGVVGNFTDRKNNYAGYFMGPVFSTASFVVSDRKLKTNISPLENALDYILSLKPKSYRFNTSKYPALNLPQGTHFGLIADELEAIFPTLVRANQSLELEGTSEKVDFKSVNYEELVPILIKGMQEQNELIQKQNDRINQLEARLANGQDTPKIPFQFRISPNPTQSQIVLTPMNASSIGLATVRIYSANGALVRELRLTEVASYYKIDIADLPAGTYRCAVQQGQQESTETFILMH